MAIDFTGKTKDNSDILGIDVFEMQRLQAIFSKTMHVYLSCVSKNVGKLTSFSDNKLEEEFVEANFPDSIRREIYDCYLDGAIENVIERYASEPHLMYRGVAIRGNNGKFLGVWLLFAVDEKKISEDVYVPAGILRTTGSDFDNTTLLLEELTEAYFAEKVRSQEQEERLHEMAEVKAQMQSKLELNEVVTSILKMMEADGSFVDISSEILKLSGGYERCSNALLLRLNKDDTTVDCIAEWTAIEGADLKDKMQGMDRTTLPFLTGRPYTISSDTQIPKDFAEFFDRFGIKAAIFQPLNINERSAMCLCYIVRDRQCIWSVERIKFANDVKRILQSMLSRRITRNSLAASYDALKLILENSGCGVSVNDVENRRSMYVNETFNQMFDNEIDILAVEDMLYEKNPEKTTISGYPAAVSGRWFDIVFCDMNWVDGRPVRLASFYDITEIKNYQKRVEFQSNMDYLTGLFNRKRLELDMDMNIRMSVRTKEDMAVMMLDLDDFNSINEGLGHRFGDEVLKAVARALDSVKEVRGHCYRTDGDEFVVIINNENIKKIDDIIGKIRLLFEKPWTIEGKELYCTMCMGVAKGPEIDSDYNTMMQEAEMALRSAKSRGKNCVEYYDPADKSCASLRIEMEKYMRKAVENGCSEFEVYYQPMIDVTSEQAVCYGAEALVRWNSPELGMVVPAQFIQLAEYLGLIIPIGEHVLREACKRCRYWNDFGHPEYGIHVNLSVVQLMQKDIVEVIGDAIRQSGITPGNLTLEITESLAINDMERTCHILEEVKKLGCHVALDDFGTGYSSLSHIRNLPIDTLKIDQSFTRNICSDGFAPSFVKTISDLAKALGMKVCVEGVENPDQKELISDMNCVEYIQGFFYDRPLPAENFEMKYLR